VSVHRGRYALTVRRLRPRMLNFIDRSPAASDVEFHHPPSISHRERYYCQRLSRDLSAQSSTKRTTWWQALCHEARKRKPWFYWLEERNGCDAVALWAEQELQITVGGSSGQKKAINTTLSTCNLGNDAETIEKPPSTIAWSRSLAVIRAMGLQRAQRRPKANSCESSLHGTVSLDMSRKSGGIRPAAIVFCGLP
jgi:hypothetical protein